MTWLSHEVVELLWFLLPGFVAAWVFRGLTAFPKASEFERVVQALIFTAFAQAGTFLVRAILLWSGEWIRNPAPWTIDLARVWSIAVAMLIGLLFAWLANGNILHRGLGLIGLTNQTSFPSEWFGAFREHGRCYVVLHLSGGRRIYGWPEEWPSDSGSGHFSLAEAEWITEDNKLIGLNGVVRILVPASEVGFVEFMEES